MATKIKHGVVHAYLLEWSERIRQDQVEFRRCVMLSKARGEISAQYAESILENALG